MPPKPLPQQLDIFEHSPVVMLRNDATDALLRRQPIAARAAVAELARASPDDPHLPTMRLLAGSLARQAEPSPLADHDALATARRHLQEEALPAANQVFDSRDAARFMRPAWQELARRCATLAFLSSRPDDHAAPLWLRAEAWSEAVQAVGCIDSWRRIPAPLAWTVHARCRLGEIDNCWPLLAELAWLSPRRLDAVLREAREPVLARLRKAFDTGFEGSGEIDDLRWFPAWVLTEQPALVDRLAAAWPSEATPGERGMRLLVELLGLERQGRHAALIERRRSLRALSPPLYSAYMKTR